MSELIEASPPTDTFCSCPHCASLGHHTTKVSWWTHYADGATVIPEAQRQLCIIRTCFSCEKTWERSAPMT